jgi:hypothetical protein
MGDEFEKFPFQTLFRILDSTDPFKFAVRGILWKYKGQKKGKMEI